MPKGSRGGKNGRYNGGGLSPSDILSASDMIVERGNNSAVDDVLQVSQDLLNMYGNDVPLQSFLIAELKDGATTLGYYDGANIAISSTYMNDKVMNAAYAECVKQGFHPSNGSKTAMQAVVAHEFGHAANDAAAKKMGLTLDKAADRIVEEARKQTGHRGVVKMAANISRYATSSNAEAVAEAFCDVYCNGSKAKAESHAIVNTMNKYIK